MQPRPWTWHTTHCVFCCRTNTFTASSLFHLLCEPGLHLPAAVPGKVSQLKINKEKIPWWDNPPPLHLVEVHKLSAPHRSAHPFVVFPCASFNWALSWCGGAATEGCSQSENPCIYVLTHSCSGQTTGEYISLASDSNILMQMNILVDVSQQLFIWMWWGALEGELTPFLTFRSFWFKRRWLIPELQTSQQISASPAFRPLSLCLSAVSNLGCDGSQSSQWKRPSFWYFSPFFSVTVPCVCVPIYVCLLAQPTDSVLVMGPEPSQWKW